METKIVPADFIDIGGKKLWLSGDDYAKLKKSKEILNSGDKSREYSEDELNEVIYEVRKFLLGRVQRRLVDIGKIYLKEDWNNGSVRRDYIHTLFHFNQTLSNMIMSFVDLDVAYSLFNSEKCNNSSFRRLLYKSCLTMTALESIRSKTNHFMKSNLELNWDMLVKTFIMFLEEDYSRYVFTTGDSKERYEIFGLDDIKGTEDVILNGEITEDWIKRYMIVLKEKKIEAILSKKDSTIISSLIRQYALSKFMFNICKTLKEDYRTMSFKIEDEPRMVYLKEAHNLEIEVDKSLSPSSKLRKIVHELRELSATFLRLEVSIKDTLARMLGLL